MLERKEDVEHKITDQEESPGITGTGRKARPTTPTSSPHKPPKGATCALSDRIITDEHQRDGSNEPRSPTMTATRPASNFADLKHDVQPSLMLQMPRARLSDANTKLERMTNNPTPLDDTPSPDETPKPPPNMPEDNPSAHQTIAFDTSSPSGRPSFRETVFFEQLDAHQQAHMVESSASGLYDLKEREMKLISYHGVKIRDFAFEARAAKEKSEAEAEFLRYANPDEHIFPESECSNIPAPVESSTAECHSQTDESPELVCERSYKNIYGSFAYGRMIKKKKWVDKEDGSSDDDDWNGLILGGNMNYGG
ncbi:hypothetical protein E2P81_ATG09963 [Venturia nashicola]|nr:hypothetical protein E2P81_ATG09963 [Venturia nashicola]